MRHPESPHSNYLLWILSILREVFLIWPSIALDIISERTLSYKCFTYCGVLDMFIRNDTCRGFGRTWFPTLPMPVNPNYPCAWKCIYAILICSTRLGLICGPAPVFTMNERRPRSYFLFRLIKLYMMSLAFENEISNLSSSLSISFFDYR